MLDSDIPLNAGCLVPIDSTSLLSLYYKSSEKQRIDKESCVVKIPEDSLLNPTPTAAVCGGNVLTSQRIVDVVLKAFNACAASQGCCK